MQVALLLDDILNAMIALETLGQGHYKQMASATHDYATKELFTNLAIAEGHHKVVYEHYKTEMVVFDQDNIDSSYADYLKQLLQQTIAFTRGVQIAGDFKENYEIALKLERDTIKLLEEFKTLTPKSYHAKIDQIIEQEKTHLKLLLELEH